MFTAMLQNIDADFIQCLEDCDYTQVQINALIAAEGDNVEIVCNATDYYWDIKLPCGTIVEAISGYRLRGFEDKIDFDD